MDWINKTVLQKKCGLVHRKAQCFQHIQSKISRVLPLIFIHMCGPDEESTDGLYLCQALVNKTKPKNEKLKS